MRTAFSKVEIESEIASRFGTTFKLHEKPPPIVLSTGLPEVDSLIGGFPRGAITEIFGPASSGRTSFIIAALANATKHEEVCALIDANDVFDPISAVEAEVSMEQLLWIRCGGKMEHAFKAADLLLQGGGFGLVVLDIGDVAPRDAQRIISSWWYRFRRTVENTATVLIVIAKDSCVRSCAALGLKMKREADEWSSLNSKFHSHDTLKASVNEHSITRFFGPRLLVGLRLNIKKQKPINLRRSEAWVYAYTPDCTKIQVFSRTLDPQQQLQSKC